MGGVSRSSRRLRTLLDDSPRRSKFRDTRCVSSSTGPFWRAFEDSVKGILSGFSRFEASDIGLGAGVGADCSGGDRGGER